MDATFILRHDPLEKWKKNRIIPKENEIIVIEYKNGSYRVCRGDGKTLAYRLPAMKKFPAYLKYKNGIIYGCFTPFVRERDIDIKGTKKYI